MRRSPTQRAQLVAQPLAGEAEGVHAPEPDQVHEPVDERDLRDHRRHVRVPRGGADHVSAGERRPPQRDPRRIDAVERARVRGRGGPVLELGRHVEQLARLAGAGTEVSVVEDQRRHPGGSEALGVGPEALLADAAPAVRQHDARDVPGRRVAARPVQPGGAALRPRPERDVAPVLGLVEARHGARIVTAGRQ